MYQKKLLIISLNLFVFSACMSTKNELTPPIATKKDTVLTKHKHKRVDSYYWLNKRDTPEVLDFLHANNAYTKAVMKPTENLQNKLFEEIKGRIKKNDASVPYFFNGYYYYLRYEGELEHPIYCRKLDVSGALEEIILDENKLAKGFAYYTAAALSVSPNNNLLAFGEDTLSRRIYTIRFKDLTTGKFLPDRLENVSAFAVWANDNKTVFYTAKDEQTLRTHKIFKHILGTPQSTDVLIYEETDERFYTSVTKFKSMEYIAIHNSSSLTDEYWLLNANNPNEAFTLFQKRVEGLEYGLEHHKNEFFILTNHQAENFKIMKCSTHKTAIENWEEVMPYNEKIKIEDIEVFDDFLAVELRENGLGKILIKSLNQKFDDYFIDFGEETYSVYIGTNFKTNTPWLRYGFTSLTMPNSVIDFNMITKEKIILKTEEVIGGYNPDEYASERIWATATDGEKIPISIVYKKTFIKNGQMPLLLYGYGSYGYTLDPYFSSTRLSLLNRGFAFAIAHVRGSEYMGRYWYENGKFLQKQNTFTDFISCAQHLINNQYTSAQHLYAMGGSAGGLLVGAAINLNPQLFNGVIAAVPFVDVVTTMLDESIPLTTGEYEEWGNPNDKTYYDYMLSYSPYDQIKKQEYPHLLVTAGYHDSQVQYWEPAKWVAKLREHKTNNNLVLLYTNMEFGHSGAAGRFESYKETALEYSFILMLENILE